MNTKLYKIEGKIINLSNYELLSGIEVSILSAKKKITIKSDKDGFYSLNVFLSIDDKENIIERPSIYFNDPSGKYQELSVIPFTQDGQLSESSFAIIKMVTKKQDLEEKKSSYKQTGIDTFKKTSKLIPKTPEDALINFIKSQIKILLNTLLPAIITLLSAFVIDNITKLLKGGKKSCPRQSKLDELVKARNRIVEQLNSISKTLDILIKTIGIITGFMGVLNVAVNLILVIPIPALTVPIGVITTASSVASALKKLTEKFTSIGVTILMALLMIKSVIAILLALLKLLDSLLLFCNPSSSLTPLSDELLFIQKEIDDENNKNELDGLDGNGLTRNVNGFILSLQTLDINAVGGLKRRQAIAKNSQGVILLKGEQSFSADDKILLDELEFYIKSNNLKAQ